MLLASAVLTVTYSGAARSVLSSPGDTCLLHRTTGLQCPLCGGTRAVVALLNGHVIEAARLNLLGIVFVVALAILIVRSFSFRVDALWARWMSLLPATTGAACAAGVVVFGVARNL